MNKTVSAYSQDGDLQLIVESIKEASDRELMAISNIATILKDGAKRGENAPISTTGANAHLNAPLDTQKGLIGGVYNLKGASNDDSASATGANTHLFAPIGTYKGRESTDSALKGATAELMENPGTVVDSVSSMVQEPENDPLASTLGGLTKELAALRKSTQALAKKSPGNTHNETNIAPSKSDSIKAPATEANPAGLSNDGQPEPKLTTSVTGGDDVRNQVTNKTTNKVTNNASQSGDKFSSYWHDEGGRLRRGDGKYASKEETSEYNTTQQAKDQHHREKTLSMIGKLVAFSKEKMQSDLLGDGHDAKQVSGVAAGGSYFYAAKEVFDLGRDTLEKAGGAVESLKATKDKVSEYRESRKQAALEKEALALIKSAPESSDQAATQVKDGQPVTAGIDAGQINQVDSKVERISDVDVATSQDSQKSTTQSSLSDASRSQDQRTGNATNQRLDATSTRFDATNQDNRAISNDSSTTANATNLVERATETVRADRRLTDESRSKHDDQSVTRVSQASEKTADSLTHIGQVSEKAAESLSQVNQASKYASESVQQVNQVSEKTAESLSHIGQVSEKSTESLNLVNQASESVQQVSQVSNVDKVQELNKTNQHDASTESRRSETDANKQRHSSVIESRKDVTNERSSVAEQVKQVTDINRTGESVKSVDKHQDQTTSEHALTAESRHQETQANTVTGDHVNQVSSVERLQESSAEISKHNDTGRVSSSQVSSRDNATSKSSAHTVSQVSQASGIEKVKDHSQASTSSQNHRSQINKTTLVGKHSTSQATQTKSQQASERSRSMLGVEVLQEQTVSQASQHAEMVEKAEDIVAAIRGIDLNGTSALESIGEFVGDAFEMGRKRKHGAQGDSGQRRKSLRERLGRGRKGMRSVGEHTPMAERNRSFDNYSNGNAPGGKMAGLGRAMAGGGALAALMAGFTKFDEVSLRDDLSNGQKGAQVTSTAVGAGGGALAGGMAGAAIGTAILPGVGTAVGGLIGSMLGGMGGEAVGSNIGESISNFMASDDTIGQTIVAAFDKGKNAISEAFSSITSVTTGALGTVAAMAGDGWDGFKGFMFGKDAEGADKTEGADTVKGESSESKSSQESVHHQTRVESNERTSRAVQRAKEQAEKAKERARVKAEKEQAAKEAAALAAAQPPAAEPIIAQLVEDATGTGQAATNGQGSETNSPIDATDGSTYAGNTITAGEAVPVATQAVERISSNEAIRDTHKERIKEVRQQSTVTLDARSSSMIEKLAKSKESPQAKTPPLQVTQPVNKPESQPVTQIPSDFDNEYMRIVALDLD